MNDGMGVGDTSYGRAKERPLVRAWLLVVLSIAVLAGLAVGAYAVWQGELRSAPAADPKLDAAAGRHERGQPVAEVALQPLPIGAPLVERAGVDADGYPRSYVDKASLKSLLGCAKFRELSAYIEQFERDFEADFHKEYFVSDSGDAFESAEVELGQKLDEWVKATPDSFAPYLARGVHGVSRGFAERGSKFAGETDTDNFKGMNRAFSPAFEDLEHALHINPRVVAALRSEMQIAFSSSRHSDLDDIAARAFSSCPACFQPRAVLQYGLEPRWGGSYAKMDRAAHAPNPSLNPKFRLLPGYADRDRGQVAAQDGQHDDALAAFERACALGDNPDFLIDKARALTQRNDDVGAVAALSRALELRPQRVDLLFARADAALRGSARNPQAAFEDLLLGLRIAPADPEARSVLPYVAGALQRLGADAQRRNDPHEALRYLDEAFDLAPSGQLEAQRTAALTTGFHGTEAELAALTQAATAAPNDLYAHQRLDYALSTLGRWDPIVAMWSTFITNNPTEGHAYYERSGTYSHLPGMHAAAKADLVRACDLGINPACVLAKRE